jgi:hypothetical protein
MLKVLFYPVEAPGFLLGAALVMFFVATTYALQRIPRKPVIACAALMTVVLYLSGDHALDVSLTHHETSDTMIDGMAWLTLLCVVCAMIIWRLQVHWAAIVLSVASAALQAGYVARLVALKSHDYRWAFAVLLTVVVGLVVRFVPNHAATSEDPSSEDTVSSIDQDLPQS